MPAVKPTEGLEVSENSQLAQKLSEGASVLVNYNWNPHKRGKYQITFSGTQRAGILRGSRKVPTLSCSLEVWPALDASPSVQYKWLTPNGGAVFLVTAQHGHPPGPLIQYQAVLNGTELSFAGVNPGTVTHRSHAGGVAVLMWQAEAKYPPSAQQFELTINPATKTNEEYWSKLASRIRIDAQSVEK